MEPNYLTINFRTKKEIPVELLNTWKLKMYYTSYGKIQAATKLSKPTISKVFSSGECTQKILEILTEYFDTIILPHKNIK
jgi:5'(3')-deoxyribonucleotidase